MSQQPVQVLVEHIDFGLPQPAAGTTKSAAAKSAATDHRATDVFMRFLEDDRPSKRAFIVVPAKKCENPAVTYDEALTVVSDELGLPSYYRACVRPIFDAPPERWPRCCGGGCEPCNEVLSEVARRIKQRLEAP